MVWYYYLFQNFPQFIVIHTVKGFGIVNKAEIDVFLELFCFFDDPADVGNLISGSSRSLKVGSIATIFFFFLLLLVVKLLNFIFKFKEALEFNFAALSYSTCDTWGKILHP